MDDATQSDGRKALYESVAEEMPLVKEVISGSTTFSDSLDQIAAGLEYGDDDAASAFGAWYSAVGSIGGAPLGIDEIRGFMNYYGFHSKKAEKQVMKDSLTAGGASAVSYGLGWYLGKNPVWSLLGRALRTIGVTGLAVTAGTHGVYVLHGQKTHNVADEAMTALYMTAAAMDNEVQDLFFPVKVEPVSAESGEAPAEPAHDGVA